MQPRKPDSKNCSSKAQDSKARKDPGSVPQYHPPGEHGMSGPGGGQGGSGSSFYPGGRSGSAERSKSSEQPSTDSEDELGRDT
jgi:hypothetical protein